MKQEQWNTMSIQQQAEYLLTHQITLKTQTFIDASVPVGKAKIVVARRAVCGGVSLTSWSADPADAVLAAGRLVIDEIQRTACN